MKQEITYALVTRLTRELKDEKNRPEKEYEIWDTKEDGFVLRVRPSGKMVYAMFYARGKKLTIGATDQIDVTQARAKAKEIRTQHEEAKRGEGEGPDAKRKRVKADTYLYFLNNTYKDWLEVSLVHGEYAYTTLLKAFPEFHQLPLNKIGKPEIEKWRTTRLKQGLSKSTINRQLSDLKACLHRANDIWELAIDHSIDKVKPFALDNNKKIRYLTADEERRLHQALDAREEDLRSGKTAYALRKRGSFSYTSAEDLKHRTFVDHLKPAVLLSLHTGLRQGELLNLTWDYVDFDRSILTVEGKTAKSGKTRHIPLSEEALWLLRTWKQEQTVKSVRRIVFPAVDGEPMSEIGKSWERLLKRAKIQNFRWHDLRHDFASKLVMSGVDLNTVRELMGHADIKMTLVYAHLAPEHKAAAVAKLNAVRIQAI
jgi:integrase